MRNYINLLGSNDHLTENRKSLFLISCCESANEIDNSEENEYGIELKSHLFNTLDSDKKLIKKIILLNLSQIKHLWDNYVKCVYLI